MDPRRSLIGQHHLGAADFFGAFGGPRREHQLQRTHILMRGSHCAASDFGLDSDFVHALALDENLDLAPVEQPLEIGQYGHREWYTRHRPLGRVDLE
jgi:hypothetical protein